MQPSTAIALASHSVKRVVVWELQRASKSYKGFDAEQKLFYHMFRKFTGPSTLQSKYHLDVLEEQLIEWNFMLFSIGLDAALHCSCNQLWSGHLIQHKEGNSADTSLWKRIKMIIYCTYTLNIIPIKMKQKKNQTWKLTSKNKHSHNMCMFTWF